MSGQNPPKYHGSSEEKLHLGSGSALEMCCSGTISAAGGLGGEGDPTITRIENDLPACFPFGATTHLRFHPSAEPYCVPGFPYRCVGSSSRLTVKAGGGSPFFPDSLSSAHADIPFYRGGAQRSAYTLRRADTHTRTQPPPPLTPRSSAGETPPTPGCERSSSPLKPGLHPAAHALDQRSSPR